MLESSYPYGKITIYDLKAEFPFAFAFHLLNRGHKIQSLLTKRIYKIENDKIKVYWSLYKKWGEDNFQTEEMFANWRVGKNA